MKKIFNIYIRKHWGKIIVAVFIFIFIIFSHTYSLDPINDITKINAEIKPDAEINIGLPSKKIKLVKAKDINGKDISGDGQICVIGQESRNPIVFRALSDKNEPIANLELSYDIVYAPESNGSSLIVKPLSEKMVTDQDGFFRANILPKGKEGKYAILFFARDQKSNFGFIEFLLNIHRKNWGNWLVMYLFGGVGILLYGMKTSADAFIKIGGSKMRAIMTKLTNRPIHGLFTGMIITFLTQSSAATSSMIVNCVNAGLLSFRRSIPLILGAAVGTSLIVQVISFKVSDYALPAIAIGVTLILMAKRPKVITMGNVIVGFGLIFYGMQIMQTTVTPLREFQFFENAVKYLAETKILALVLAAVFTALVHSSGATLGITMALATQGFFTIETAIPIIFGANIGTTATALMITVGTTKDAKRVAWCQLIFKVLGVLILLPFIKQIAGTGEVFSAFLSDAIHLGDNSITRQIANTHTLVNVCWAFIFLPLYIVLEKITMLIIPNVKSEMPDEFSAKYLSLNVDNSMSASIGSALREISRMSRFIEEMMSLTGKAIFEKNIEIFDVIEAKEQKVDKLRQSLTNFLIQLSKHYSSEQDAQRIIKLLFVVSDLENTGDIIYRNVLTVSKKMIDYNLEFSIEGLNELQILYKIIADELSKTVIALTANEPELAQKVVENKKEVFRRADIYHISHLKRLKQGLKESYETSAIHLDLINNLMRVEYYVASIASIVIDKSKRNIELSAELNK